jgi:Glycosyl hydrolases family 35
MTESSQLSHAPPLVELRYFAAPRDDWELLLLRARQLGVGAIAAHVPWVWHAPTGCAFDLDGTTDERRDLVGFVRLCSRLGLHVLLHPGPLHGNLLGGGAPPWLLQQHPAACALDQDGTPWRDAGNLPHPSALHPAFLAAARDWIAVFSAAMRALQAPTGPIIALHAGVAGTPDRLDYNQAAAAHPNAPDLLPETLGAFAAWYADAAAAITIDWLRAEGWSVALRRGQLFWERSNRPESSLAAPHAEPGDALLLELPGGSHSLIAAAPTPADCLLRNDGSPRLNFWRVKMSGLLIATAGSDAANASAPADLALADTRAPRRPAPARAAGAALAQRLRQASIAFDILDLEVATPQELARYALIILPGALALKPATQQKLAQCANIVLLSDQTDAASFRNMDADDLSQSPNRPTSPTPQLPTDIGADQLAELIEERGGIARYAWADGANIDLVVRYGANHTYLAIDNRRPTPYNGILAYRGRDGAVLHLHAGIGARCAGMVLLADDEVYGAAIDGDGAEGGWLARGLRSSAMFNTGAGALARCGAGLLLTAPQSGRFQARRAEGWSGMRAHRLLLSGALLPAQVQIDAAHIAIAYVAEDTRGQTDLYLILPAGDMPPLVRSYLATLLAARTAMLRRAATLAEGAPEQRDPLDTIAHTIESFTAAADYLAAIAEQFTTLDEYSAAWIAADDLCRSALTALAQALTQARGALLAGQLDPAAHEAIERRIARIMGVATRLNPLELDQ